ncbi:Ku domain protein [Acidisarcina polymorpha]|uniref:Non-homologous end joining protein Ku n=1 Tax=Acidisarcina polymorpha TaxID=2211140 RepID=A0A2Z5FW74_9BACT|nr:Ku protein [Acidisarcina polymorpha]AXC11139.1 Ku domain protein [Acidisarcina polymorpha]
MAARPYWSGHIQISLVSFGVKLFTATESMSEIRFHQLDRKTGERVKYQKVSSASEESKVEKTDIVKGYEYSKGQYVTVEPEEIENLRIPSRHTLEVAQFVDAAEVDPSYFEKPYFVVPESDTQAEAFAVVRKALQKTKKIALGKIAFGGREHLVAIAPPADDKLAGMMAYTMRYAAELRNPASYFADIKPVAIEEDQLSLAEELIKRKSAKFAPEKFKDEYETALKAMVEAKVHNAPIPREEPAPASSKVINLMDALRKSVQRDEGDGEAPRKASTKSTAAKSTPAAKKGIALVKAKSRKTA